MKTNNPNFKAGYTARMSDLSKEANPFAFDASPRRMWAIGWDYADAKKEEAAANAEPLERVPAKPFEQGQNAAKNGIDFRDCPYGSGDPHGTPEEQATNAAWVGWRAGHRATREAKLGITPVDFGTGSDAVNLQQIGRALRKPVTPIFDHTNFKIASTLPYGFVSEEHHYARVAELLNANNVNVERRRVAERKLAEIGELIAMFERDPREV
jgi:ribosome modulation factor